MKKRKFFLTKAIFDIYRNSLAYISSRVAQFGIGRGQWYFINHLLFGRDGISQEQLSKELFVDSAHTARAVKKLEDGGFVFRKPDLRDARKKNVYVTEKAIAIKDDYHKLYQDLNKILVDGFTPEELKLVRSFFYRMRKNIVSYMGNSERDFPR
ncbi:MAG: MarR family transcriptional regulator [Firmicutes bacterium]|nr:MarR family transcriptional regulator [Bacillota bacterium]